MQKSKLNEIIKSCLDQTTTKHHKHSSYLLCQQHVLQPVCAVGNLDRKPVGLIVLHSAMPVGTKSEDIAVEVVFGVAVSDWHINVAVM